MKRKILIASFLKPVNDIRSYSKIAQSLALNSSYSVYCIGYPTNIELRDNKIKLLPLSYFNKSGFGRLLARWQAFKLYVKVKPELIIVNSPDLLIITCLYKILFGSQIIYDIRENYFRNLWYQQNYSWGTRHFFALVIRSKEVILSPLFSHFILAEKVYEKQLNFIGNRFSVIENKSLI
ncbi:MAG: glycosyltransferase, partial [Cyclobacteriaceae bacterium]|nr:glycosyltransferase [Cyclobacteriaceae bacterium]